MKDSVKNKHVIFLLILGVLVNSLHFCTEPPDEDSRIIPMENAGSRLVIINEVVSWDTTVTLGKVSGKPSDSLLLVLEAEVSPPMLDDTQLQATDITIQGNKAYVSYNIQGEPFGGGVEVYDISAIDNPQLLDGILIDDSDVNGLYVHGSDLFLAIAKESGGPGNYAAVEKFTLAGGLPGTESELVDLPSWAATDVVTSGQNLFVTTGADDGYICILNRNTLEFLDTLQVDDARGIGVDGQNLAVIAGTPARLLVFDGELGDLLGDYTLEGATIPFSKSTVEILGGKALVGIGDGGAQIICLDSGAPLVGLPAPILDDLPVELTVTNAVTAQGDVVFMANGEAGVYVGQTNTQLTSNNCNINEMALVGKLQLGDDQSVNHISYRSGMLFIASGLGGLKIISIVDA